jgi:hypothetical protein
VAASAAVAPELSNITPNLKTTQNCKVYRPPPRAAKEREPSLLTRISGAPMVSGTFKETGNCWRQSRASHVPGQVIHFFLKSTFSNPKMSENKKNMVRIRKLLRI